jgi:hypothetical protein
MAIIKEQHSLAVILGISRLSVVNYIREGMPHNRDGFSYYFDTKEVSEWLKKYPKRAHLVKELEKYNEKEGE